MKTRYYTDKYGDVEIIRKLRKNGCRYCGVTSRLTIDHKQPLSLGGTNDKKNLQCLCYSCNQTKSSIPHQSLINLFIWYERRLRDKDTKFMRQIKKKISSR